MPAMLTIEKMLDVIELICSSPEGRGTRSLARELDLNVATVHNIAHTLVNRSYLRQDAAKRFHPGTRLLLLGRREDYLEQLTLIARPLVRQLAITLNESIMLGTIDHGQIIKLDYIPGTQALRVHEPQDMSGTAYCTAIGKMMLAAMPAPALATYLKQTPLRKFTPHTLDSVRKLSEELERIRAQGYATTRDELCEGISAIAVAVQDPWGSIVAAIGASAPTVRMSKPQQSDRALKSLRQTAAKLAAAWAGYREPDRHDAEKRHA